MLLLFSQMMSSRLVWSTNNTNIKKHVIAAKNIGHAFAKEFILIILEIEILFFVHLHYEINYCMLNFR